MPLPRDRPSSALPLSAACPEVSQLSPVPSTHGWGSSPHSGLIATSPAALGSLTAPTLRPSRGRLLPLKSPSFLPGFRGPLNGRPSHHPSFRVQRPLPFGIHPSEPLRQALPLSLHLSFGALSHADVFLICLPFPSGEPCPRLRTDASRKPSSVPGARPRLKIRAGRRPHPHPLHTSRGPKPRMAPGIGSSCSAFPPGVVYELSPVARATPAVGSRAGGVVPAPTRALVAVTRQTDVTSHPTFSPTLPTQRHPAWDNS